MRWLAGWRLSLRLARRDALRARGRSILALVMIALPVLGVTAADVVMQTQDVSGVESLDRRLGAAEARVVVQSGGGAVYQAPDPDDGLVDVGGELDKTLTARQVAAELDGARLVEERAGSVRFDTEKGEADAEVTEVDLQDPATSGLFRLASGRWPAARGEVVVNAAVAAKGYEVGDVLETPSDRVPDPMIVGVAESTTTRDYPMVAGPLGSLGVDTYGSTTWLVDGDPVTWGEVRALNIRGASVLSRAVVQDPPPLPPRVQKYVDSASSAMVAVAVLVGVMALIEVVLLAGPAFAVGARRQSRTLALLSATGGTPAQSRRVVLASAVVLGGVASVVGVAAGIGVGRLLVPVVQGYSSTWFGPFEVPWVHLAGVAAFGLLSAFLAAVVPATIASRQDVVAVLSGRRGDRRPSLRSPLLGLVLLGAGVAGAAYGAVSPDRGEYFIAGAAIVSVLGMILLVPVALVLVSRLASRLPLTLRYAARDAARHRSRTVPAVAAVAATVAGVVALGIATSSDEAQNEAGYVASVADGIGLVTADGTASSNDWATYRRVVEQEVPDATVRGLRGIARPRDGFADTSLNLPNGDPLLDSYGSALGSDVMVSDGALPTGLVGVDEMSDADRERVRRVLAAGGLVAFTDLGADGDRVRLRLRRYDAQGERVGRPVRATLPAVVVHLTTAQAGPQAVLSGAAARRLGLPVATVGLAVSGTDISKQQEEDVIERLAGTSASAGFHVERGYQADDEVVVVQLILFALGAVLMLGGTLTATFLALSDARPDLATLAAVGAAPRTRRGVAAAYAVVVGVVGALLGVVVGFIPGVAITYPLTGGGWMPGDAEGPSHYLAVPWLLILGLVVALPALTALTVGLCVRSRLPLVARVD